MANIFRAFRHTNYKKYFLGQMFSVLGSWMQTVAISWLAYRLTNSTVLLGTMLFVNAIPTIILMPIAGHIADKFNRHKLMYITQVTAAIQAAILAVLSFTNTITVWQLFALTALSGVINSFEMPVRHAFVYDLVPHEEDLPNAIALNSTIFNLARLLGPSIGGILIAYYGEGVCFIVNSLSYIALLTSLTLIHLPGDSEPLTSAHNKTKMLDGIKESFTYAKNTFPIKAILLLVMFISLLGTSYNILMPVFAKDILGGDSRTLGFLMSSVGVGALTAALNLAAQKKGQEIILAFSSLIMGTGIIFFSKSNVLFLSMFLLFFVGFGMTSLYNSANALLQTLSAKHMRGRVMSLYTLSFMGVTPISSLSIGYLAKHIGPSNTVLLCGFFSIICSVFFLLNLTKFTEEKNALMNAVTVTGNEIEELQDK